MTNFCKLFFTARFARDAEAAELIILSSAVERTAEDNHSATSWQITNIFKQIMRGYAILTIYKNNSLFLPQAD
jgi:hypothetical protein